MAIRYLWHCTATTEVVGTDLNNEIPYSRCFIAVVEQLELLERKGVINKNYY